MVDITLSVGTMSRSWTFSAANVTRILNALKVTYGPVFDEPIDPLSQPRERTNAEVFDHLAKDFIDSLKKAVDKVEGGVAAAAARAAVPSVDAT